ncbi:MAG TPA: hypothetical protein VGQ58_00280 [Candidatus Limnocylindrales bacterium]|jgi:hypothetical protein|nr:hypothetical protein [Candidatus Limnocylindrales bacterium]
MTRAKFTRLGGFVTLLGGTLWVVSFGVAQAISPQLTGILAAPAILLLIGLIALQARHATGGGPLGVTAFAITVVGMVMLAYGSVGRLVVTGEIFGLAYGPVGFTGLAPGALVLGAGAVLTAISVISANVMPRLSPIPLLVGATGVAAAGGSALARQLLNGSPADIFPLELGPLAALWALFGLGWLWLGYLLWSERPKATTVQ